MSHNFWLLRLCFMTLYPHPLLKTHICVFVCLCVCAQILECSLFTSTLLAEVYVPIPDSQQSRHCSVPETYQFSSDRVVSPFHTAVGSGTHESLSVFHYDGH